MSQQPYEILGVPAEIWVAPVSTVFPALNATPGVAWMQLGKRGKRSLSSDGVKVLHSQKVTFIRPDGATGPVKAFRDEEDLAFEITLWDLTLEAYRFALNGVGIAEVAAAAGTPGTKATPIARGANVAQFALLFRVESPYMDGAYLQIEVPVAVQVGNATVVFAKGKPAGLATKWQALEDPDAASDDSRFGRVIAQHQAAL